MLGEKVGHNAMALGSKDSNCQKSVTDVSLESATRYLTGSLEVMTNGTVVGLVQHDCAGPPTSPLAARWLDLPVEVRTAILLLFAFVSRLPSR